MNNLQAQEQNLRNQGKSEEARDAAQLMQVVENAGESMRSALLGLSRGRREDRRKSEIERFHQSLYTIMEAASSRE